MKIFKFYRKIDDGWQHVVDRAFDSYLLADDSARFLAWLFCVDIKIVYEDDEFTAIVRFDEKENLEKVVISLLDDLKSFKPTLKCKRKGPDTPLWSCPSEYDSLGCEACKFHYYE